MESNENMEFDIYEIDRIANEDEYMNAIVISLRSIEHILNSITIRDRNINNYTECLFSDVISKISAINNTVNTAFLFDEIIYLLKNIIPAFKHILYSPRTNLVKENVKIAPNKLKGMPNATTKWLNKQPGRNFYEKMKGKNKVLAVSKNFSYDTKENQVFMFYIRRLFLIIEDRKKYWNGFETYYKRNDDVSTIVQQYEELFKRVRHTELYYLEGRMYEQPNNVLINDKNYSIVWKGVQNLLTYQSNLVNSFKMLEQRLMYVMALCLAGELNKYNKIKVLDMYGKIMEYNGRLLFSIKSEEICDFTLFCIDNRKTIYTINLRVDNSQIIIYIRLLDDNYIVNNYQCILYDRYHIKIGFEDEKISKYIKIYKNDDFIKEVTSDVKGIFEVATDIAEGVLPHCLNSENKKEKTIKTQYETFCIDFSSFLPTVNAVGYRNETEQPLYALSWSNQYDDNIFYPNKKGIYPTSKTEVIAMKSILNGCNLNNIAAVRKIMQEILSNVTLGEENYLIYLVPDNIDEFSQKNLKSLINVMAKKTYPVWRSVAAAYCLGNEKFREKQGVELKQGTRILVFDFYADESNPILIKMVNDEDCSLIYEHYSPYDGIDEEVNITNYDIFCKKYLDEIIRKYDMDLTEKEKNHILISGTVGKIIENGASENYIIERENLFFNIQLVYDEECYQMIFNQAMKMLHKYISENRVLGKSFDYIIILGDHIGFKGINEIKNTFRESKLFGRVLYFNQKNITFAGLKINERLKNGLAVWKEYLPNLSLEVIRNGHYEEFSLINNKSANSVIGMKQVIETDNTEMVLSKNGRNNKKNIEYKFPLIKGNGNKYSKQFYAKIVDKSFPLDQDTNVRMEIYYQYGVEESYELYVLPVGENAKFSKIKVEWEERVVDELIVDDPEIIVTQPLEKLVDVIMSTLDWITKQLLNAVKDYWNLDGENLNKQIVFCTNLIDKTKNYQYCKEIKDIYDYIQKNMFKYIWDIVTRSENYYTENNFYSRHELNLKRLVGNCNTFLATVASQLNCIPYQDVCFGNTEEFNEKIDLMDYFIYK